MDVADIPRKDIKLPTDVHYDLKKYTILIVNRQTEKGSVKVTIS